MKPLISTAAAEKLIAQHLPLSKTINCPIEQAAGKILRQDIHADRAMPPYNRAMMDGYAFRHADLLHSNCFTITGQAPAGSPQTTLPDTLSSCVEIMTGAVVPDGADCVVRYEDTQTVKENQIIITATDEYEIGDFIHYAGSDRKNGEKLLSSGAHIGSREIAIAATCGLPSLKVARMPRIIIATSGDELVPIDSIPSPHQIRRSNGIAIQAALANQHFQETTVLHLPDDLTQTINILNQALQEADYLILTGGISMGKKDYIPEALSTLSLTNHFHGVAQKPGKPFGFWSNSTASVFTLPGNPLSVLVSLHRYVIPALRSTLGAHTKPQTVKLTQTIKPHPKLDLFIPVCLQANNQATPLPAQNSGDFVSILKTDGFVQISKQNTLQRVTDVDSQYNYHPWH